MTFINNCLPCKVNKHVAYDTLYILAVESALAVANLVPVLLKAISKTSSVWPEKVFIQVPCLTSHSLQVPSIEEVAQYYPVN
jgi:hypothetical protein